MLGRSAWSSTQIFQMRTIAWVILVHLRIEKWIGDRHVYSHKIFNTIYRLPWWWCSLASSLTMTLLWPLSVRPKAVARRRHSMDALNPSASPYSLQTQTPHLATWDEIILWHLLRNLKENCISAFKDWLTLFTFNIICQQIIIYIILDIKKFPSMHKGNGNYSLGTFVPKSTK